MSYIKKYFEEHFSEFTDDELYDNGFSDEEIKFYKECFNTNEES